MQDGMAFFFPHFHQPNSANNINYATINATDECKCIVDNQRRRMRNQSKTNTTNDGNNCQCNLSVEKSILEEKTNWKLQEEIEND